MNNKFNMKMLTHLKFELKKYLNTCVLAFIAF